MYVTNKNNIFSHPITKKDTLERLSSEFVKIKRKIVDKTL